MWKIQGESKLFVQIFKNIHIVSGVTMITFSFWQRHTIYILHCDEVGVEK